MSARGWAWLRLAGGALVLAVLVWRVGTGPFAAGLHTVSAVSVGTAVVIGALTTLCAALRWRIVARGLGMGMPVGTAVAAYYRAQFLNTALPGGVLGDVHRAVQHGRAVGDVGRGARAVVWERSAGQVVQIVLAVVVLCVFDSPVRAAMPLTVAVAAAVALAVVLLVRRLPRRGTGTSRCARIATTIGADLRRTVLARRTGLRIAAMSVVVVIGQTVLFVVAARTAGTSAPVAVLLPIAMLVLVAMALPINIGGWGPREGVAAWLFGAAGLGGAAAGVATATAYGVLVIAASLPGAAVLIAEWARRRLGRTDAASEVPDVSAVHNEHDVRELEEVRGG